VCVAASEQPGYYVRSGCTGTVIGVEGFDNLSQIYFDNMFRPLLCHLQVIQFWRLLVCDVSHILILYSVSALCECRDYSFVYALSVEVDVCITG
jgi:hypothetical protein